MKQITLTKKFLVLISLAACVLFVSVLPAGAGTSCSTYSSGRTTCRYATDSFGSYTYSSYNPNSGYSSYGSRSVYGNSSYGSSSYSTPSSFGYRNYNSTGLGSLSYSRSSSSWNSRSGYSTSSSYRSPFSTSSYGSSFGRSPFSTSSFGSSSSSFRSPFSTSSFGPPPPSCRSRVFVWVVIWALIVLNVWIGLWFFALGILTVEYSTRTHPYRLPLSCNGEENSCALGKLAQLKSRSCPAWFHQAQANAVSSFIGVV